MRVASKLRRIDSKLPIIIIIIIIIITNLGFAAYGPWGFFDRASTNVHINFLEIASLHVERTFRCAPLRERKPVISDKTR